MRKTPEHLRTAPVLPAFTAEVEHSLAHSPRWASFERAPLVDLGAFETLDAAQLAAEARAGGPLAWVEIAGAATALDGDGGVYVTAPQTRISADAHAPAPRRPIVPPEPHEEAG